MSAQDENEAIASLTGFSLSNILGDLIPSSSSLSRLGLGGSSALNSGQIYGDKWDDDADAVGRDQGDDWEDQIDKEMELEEEDEDVSPVKAEPQSPGALQPERRVKIIKRLVERPKSVYDRFPSFEPNKVLDFSELFKGYTVQKSRLSKRPFNSEPASRNIYSVTNAQRE